MNNSPIGIFDSGLGGFTCMFPLMRELPNESFIYFGDTARTPYGDKDNSTIFHFSTQIADFLVEKHVKMLLIACNTISALCAKFLADKYPDVQVVDIISPTVDYLIENEARFQRVGLIATRATVRNKAYSEALSSGGFNKLEVSIPCPLFVPLVEEGIIRGQLVEDVVKHYLDEPVKQYDLDALVLGCTHYPFIEDVISELYPQLTIINPSALVVQKAIDRLGKNGLKADTPNEGTREFWASDLSETYCSMIDRITGYHANQSFVFKEKKWRVEGN